jgi:Bacterial regulatory protein, Fis family
MRLEKKSVLSPEAVESLPEFAPLNDQRKTFVLLVAGGAPIVSAVQTAYECKNLRSARVFAYDILRRRSMRPILNKLFGESGNEFLEKVAALIRELPPQYSLHVQHHAPIQNETTGVPDYIAEANYREAKRKFETAYLRRMVEAYRWNIAKAARVMGLERSSLHKKLTELGIQRPTLVADLK